MFISSPDVAPAGRCVNLEGLRLAPPRSIVVARDSARKPIRIGHGGTRGSSVYLISCNGVRRALKSCWINPSEFAFCQAMQAFVAEDGALTSKEYAGADCLAAPLYLVTATSFSTDDDAAAVKPGEPISASDSPSDVVVGIVMPFFDASLHRLLADPAALRSAIALTGSPLSPQLSAMETPAGSDSMDSPRRSSSSDSGAGEEDATLAFHTARHQHRIRSLVVIAAILEQVVKAIAFLHYRLPHTTMDTAYRGFAHQDLRSDNILVARDGSVAVCDFELLGHFPAEPHPPHSNGDTPSVVRSPNSAAASVRDPGPAVAAVAGTSYEGPVPSLFTQCHHSVMSSSFSSADGGDSCSGSGARASVPLFTRRNGTRLIPRGFWAPEGANMAKSDVWLIGLVALELYTGVCPIIRANVAFDDFGPGPYLGVDPDNGIGWQHLDVHVAQSVRRWPDPANAGVEAADPVLRSLCVASNKNYAEELSKFVAAFRSFCSRCFANNPQDRADPQELLSHELFTLLRDINGPQATTKALIKTWVASTMRHPPPSSLSTAAAAAAAS